MNDLIAVLVITVDLFNKSTSVLSDFAFYKQWI